MVNPGNSELLLASVEWLSGLDDWIAAGPIGQQTRPCSWTIEKHVSHMVGNPCVGHSIFVGVRDIICFNSQEKHNDKNTRYDHSCMYRGDFSFTCIQCTDRIVGRNPKCTSPNIVERSQSFVLTTLQESKSTEMVYASCLRKNRWCVVANATIRVSDGSRFDDRVGGSDAGGTSIWAWLQSHLQCKRLVLVIMQTALNCLMEPRM